MKDYKEFSTDLIRIIMKNFNSKTLTLTETQGDYTYSETDISTLEHSLWKQEQLGPISWDES